MAAFVVIVFAVASGVLIAGAPLRYAWFAQQPVTLGSLTLNPTIAALPVIAELAFAVVLMLFGLWFLRNAKGRGFYYLLAATLIALGPSSSDFWQPLLYPRSDGIEHFWFWPVYGLRTVGLIGFGLTLLLFPTGRFASAVAQRVGWIWAVLCTLLFLFPALPLNFIYGSDRPLGLGLALPVDEWIGTFGSISLIQIVFSAQTMTALMRLEPALQMAVAFGFIALFIGLQVQRYRSAGATSLERQQLRWGWLGTIFLTFGMVLYYGYGAILRVLQIEAGSGLLIYALLTVLATVFMGGFAACYSVALLRPPTFELRLFSRSSLAYFVSIAISVGLLLAVLTGFNALTGAARLLPLGVLGAVGGLLLVIALRDALQMLAVRFVGADSDDPFRVLESLRSNLEATRDPAQILPAAAQTVAAALRLSFVRIVAYGRGSAVSADVLEQQTLAQVGIPSLQLQQYPFVLNGVPVGFLEIAPRTSEDPLTRAELRLLETVVGQLGTSTQTLMLHEELKRANMRLKDARESERQRLRDDLHDGVLGALAGMKMKLGVLEMRASSDLLSGVMRDLDHTQVDVRRLVNGLHASALEESGLRGALEQYVGLHGGLSIELRTQGLPSHTVALEVQAVALRIAQEAITNVIKHACAQHCVVSLRLESQALLLEIEDDGVGLPVSVPSGQGLRSMRERAARIGGSLELGSGSRGTWIKAHLPLQILGSA